MLHAPVGSFAPNWFGLHDVHGNVWEWCRDLRAPYATAPRLGDGYRLGETEGGRIARGGCFWVGASWSRCSGRNALPEDGLDLTIGVRPARAISL